MRIIPVLDIQSGVVVRGIAGRRQEYRPIVSRLTDSCQAIDIARMFRDRFGMAEMYVADLDAIAGAAPARSIYDDLRALGCRLWVDAGVRRRIDAETLIAAQIDRVVVGLETVASPAELSDIVRACGPEITFSLDLKNGEPLGDVSAWHPGDSWATVCCAIEAGVSSIIVLDLARVGVPDGPGTENLCRRVAHTYPEVELVAGGGVRDISDLRRLQDCGVDAVLVASALHDGRITVGDLQSLHE